MDIIDCHVHPELSGNYFEDITRLTNRMLCHGIGKAILSDLGDGWQAFPDRVTLEAANERLRKAVFASKGRLEYLVYINPQLDDWQSIFERYIADSCGVKLWISLRSEEYGLERTKDVLRLAASYDKAVLIHTFDRTNAPTSGAVGIADVIELARSVPDCLIVAAHSGGNWRNAISHAEEIPENVVFDISGSYPERTMVQRLVSTFGSNRILYGSDAFGRSFSSQLSKVFSCNFEESDLKKILCENSIRVFKISAPEFAEKQNIPTWSIPKMNEDNFCFTGKGVYWDHDVSAQTLANEAERNNVGILYAASLEALTASDFVKINLQHKVSCQPYSRIKPLAVADLRDMEQSLKTLELIDGFAGVLVSPYLHGYQLEYEKYAKFFDICGKQNIAVWINTALSDDRFRDARLDTRVVSTEEIIAFAASAPVCRYTFQGCPADASLSSKLPSWCRLECSRLSDHEYAPDAVFAQGCPERFCFGSEYPFREFSTVSDVLGGRV